jgi:hypothetical protein
MTTGAWQTVSDNLQGPNGVRWAWTDQSAGGAVQFGSIITIAENLDPDHVENVFYRALSMFVLSRIRDSNIKEACEALSDIYQWQVDSEKVVVSDPKIIDFGSSELQRVDRQPFQSHRDW